MFGSVAACVNRTGVVTAGAMLDGIGAPTPLGAYSLDKIVGSYAGSAIRVQRADNGTQLDIGFTGAGLLNTSAISTFCSSPSTSGYVRVWYDQSGNGRNLTQTTLANMFQIYNGTVINTVTRNSVTKPVLYAEDQNRGMITAAFTATNTANATGVVVGQLTNAVTTNSPRYLSLMPTTTTLGDVEAPGAALIARNTTLQEWGSNRAKGWRASQTGIYNTIQHVISRISGTTYEVTVDGLVKTGNFDAGTNIQATRIGVAHTGFQPQSSTGMRIAEVVVWDSSLSAATRTNLSTRQFTKFGITAGTTPTPDPDPGPGNGERGGLDWDSLGYEEIFFDDFTTGYNYVYDGSHTFTSCVNRDWWVIYGDINGTVKGNEDIGFRKATHVSVDPSGIGICRIKGLNQFGSGLYGKNVGGLNHQKYGGWEFRFRTSTGYGYGACILLWPAAEDWPVGGETDILEIPKGTKNNRLHTTLHIGANNSQDGTSQVGDWTTWHTISCIWTATEYKFYLDGKQFNAPAFKNLKFQAPRKMRIGIQYDVGGLNAKGNPGWIAIRDSSTPQPSYFDLDFVRVLRKA